MWRVSFLWLCGAVGNLQKPRKKPASFRKENKGKVRKRIRVLVVVVMGVVFVVWGFFAGCVLGSSHGTVRLLIGFS